MHVAVFIAIVVLAAVAMNALIFAQKWNNNSNNSIRTKKAPPGYVIGTIWIVVLAALAWTLFQVRKITAVAFLISFTILYCLSYPILTRGFQKYSKTLNVTAFGLSIACIGAAIASTRSQQNIEYAWIGVVPITLWTTYVVIFLTFNS